MRKLFSIAIAIALLCAGIAAQADVFNMGAGLKSLEFVTVGDPGNADGVCNYVDTTFPVTGAVAYTYEIGKYEVTSSQYCEFLNAKAKTDPYQLYGTGMDTDSYACGIVRSGADGSYTYSVKAGKENFPVNYVNYWSAIRFLNWLGNGQGDGDTETGGYPVNGFYGVDDDGLIVRSAATVYAIPTLAEFNKAGYYKGGGTDAGYWTFATQTDENPLSDVPPGGTNSANYYPAAVYCLYSVGSFVNSISYYGTFDQSGNIGEFIDYTRNGGRFWRGGDYDDGQKFIRAFNNDANIIGTNHSNSVGFRVVRLPAAGSNLTGTVDLADFTGDKAAVAVTVELRGTATTSYNPTLDANGLFTISGVADGTYGVWAKASHWLAKLTSDVVVSGNTNMGTISLINGDCDGDNEITSTDLSILGLALGTVPGDGAWDATADLDGDSEVTSTDLSILGINLGASGD